MKLATFSLILSAALCPLFGQISQSHPEYCGRPGGANPPLPNVSATFNSDGEAVLFVGATGSRREIPLHGAGSLASFLYQIDEVCPLGDGRLVVFGGLGATETLIVDPAKPAVVDDFFLWQPVISPDRRWIVYDKMSPAHGVEATSEELIYDLSKSPAQNRPDGDLTNTADVGAVLFPPGQQNVLGDNINVPRDQVHSLQSSFYWASDSRAILFEDKLEGQPYRIILITLDEKGTPTALEHGITAADLCGASLPDVRTLLPRLDRAEIGPDRNGARAMVLDLSSDDARCPARILQLSSNDFKPTKTETHIKPEPTHGAIVNGQEAIPPKKK
jgi:hypothetical protein